MVANYYIVLVTAIALCVIYNLIKTHSALLKGILVIVTCIQYISIKCHHNYSNSNYLSSTVSIV